MWIAEKNIFNFFYYNIHTKNLNYKKKEILLNYLFKNKFNKSQKKTIIKSIIYNKIIITGKPGTGKTTIIAKIIILIIKIIQKKQKIILTAPTGKATILLKNKFKKIINNFNLKKKEKKNINYKSATLHQLLGLKKTTNKPYYNKNKKININILIIDESSMIDFFLMFHLINALSKNTKIFLVGDSNQLPPINQGNIFNDICNYIINKKKNKISYLLTNKNFKKKKENKNIICKLKKTFRFKKKSQIYKLSQIILKKKNLIKKINNILKKKNEIIFKKIKNNIKFNNMIKKFINYYYNNNKKSFIQKFNTHRILCVIKSGLFGIKKINKYIEYYIIYKKKIPYIKINNFIYYNGKPIMITKNNKILNIFNGEIGIIKIKNNNIILKINKKKIPISCIRNYENTWSTTIHKAQGSEFKKISIILPNNFIPILTNQLIYTAITRAKKKIYIYGKKKIFLKSCINKFKKYSGIIK